MKAVKTILCYGDSNTFGADPASRFHRFEPEVRWPGRLQLELGTGYRVVEEGLCGRTSVFDDPFELGRNGRKCLPICLESHKPLDLVILMLGTNDMKRRFSVSALEVAMGVTSLVPIIRGAACGGLDENGLPGPSPEILLVSPAHIDGRIEGNVFREMFGTAAIEKSHALAGHLESMARDMGCRFFDAAQVAAAGVDGLHLTAESHEALAKALAGQVREIFGA